MSLFQTLLADRQVEPPVPASFGMSTWAVDGSAYAYINSRKTVLEPSVAGVDKPFSWSAWIRVNNIDVAAQRIFGNAFNGAGDQQYGLFLQSQTGATNNQKIQFSIFTNTTNFITVRSTDIFLKNRFIHVVITYDGSETAAGLKMYFNGVLDSTATHVTTGTYTGAINSANNRFQISSFFASANRFKGNMRNLCVWNAELSQSDVDELYGDGEIVNPTTVSFYGTDIVGHWPLFSSVACLNDSSLDFTNDAGVGFATLPMSPFREGFSIVNAIPGNTSYVAFGDMFRSSEGVFHIYTRRGTDHLTAGDLYKYVATAANLKTGAVAAGLKVVDDATYDLRGGPIGIINNQIILLTSRYNTGASPTPFVDEGRYESTDGMTGETFGSWISMDTPPGSGYSLNFYGKTCLGFTPGELIAASHEYTVPAQEIFIQRRSAAGTWTKESVCTGGSGDGYNEPAILRIGNIYIMLIRAQASARLEVCFGTEVAGVITWTAPANTGLSVGVAMASMAVAPDGTITVAFADRGDGYMKVSRGNRLADIMADATDWHAASSLFRTIDLTANILGYPSICYDGWNLAMTVSSEFSSTRADLFFGYGLLG